MTRTRAHRLAWTAIEKGSLVLLLLAWTPAWGAELPFGSQTNILTSANSVNTPVDLAAGDINQDGVPDLVMCAEDSGQLWLHYGRNISGSTIAIGLDSPRTADIGDIDLDGDMDVIIGQYDNIAAGGQAEIIWYESTGPGTWAAHDVYRLTVTGVRSIKLADIDGDGDLDYVLAAEGDPDTANSSLSWRENTVADTGTVGWSTGHHSFGATTQRPWDVEVADIDGDGDLDVAAADVGLDTVTWYENDGTPAVGYWTEHTVRSSFNGASSVTLADVDGDGAPDIIASAVSDDRISWFENPSWTEHNVVLGINGPASVEAADMDFDGDFDIVCTRETDSEVLWIENVDGDGGIWLRHSVNTSFGGAVDALPVDMDGDGDLDIAAVGLTEDALSWWENQNTHRRFAETDPITIRSGLNDPRGIAVADVNGDGLKDVVLGGWGDAWVRVYLQLTGTAWLQNNVDTGVSGFRDVAVADVDRDGDMDILGASVTGDLIAWWANSGAANPTWTQHNVLTSFDGAHAVEPVDLDHDGDIDLVVTAVDADESTIVINDNGVGTLWTKRNFTPLDGAYDVAVGDLNQDGMMDFVSSGYYDDRIRVDLQGESLWGYLDITGLDGPRGVALGDFNGDGDLDIVAAIRLDDDIKWFENNGSATSWTAHDVGSGFLDDGSEVQAVDIDHDGDVDVVGTGYAGHDVVLWTNDGNGSSWTRRFIESGLDTPWQAIANDITGDDKMDLVVAAAGSTDSLTWYENVGAQFATLAYDYAPALVEDGDKAAVFNFLVSNNGRTGDDHSLEIATLVLDFETAGGTPLTSAQVNDIVDRMEIYLDADDNLIWDDGVDTLISTDTYLSLVSGTLTFTFSHALAGNTVTPEHTEGFFVVLQAAADASQHSPNTMVVTFRTDQLECADRTAQTPLEGEPATDRATDPISFGASTLIFSDGFESGNTSAWSDEVDG